MLTQANNFEMSLEMQKMAQMILDLQKQIKDMGSQINSQNNHKQSPGTQEEDDYHVPVFGSQKQEK